jgi:hypothetical protein
MPHYHKRNRTAKAAKRSTRRNKNMMQERGRIQSYIYTINAKNGLDYTGKRNAIKALEYKAKKLNKYFTRKGMHSLANTRNHLYSILNGLNANEFNKHKKSTGNNSKGNNSNNNNTNKSKSSKSSSSS